VAKALGASEVRLVEADATLKTLGLTDVNTVNPLAVVNDEKKEVTVAVEKKWEKDASQISLHLFPLTNNATVTMKVEDVKKVVEAHGNSFVYVDYEAAAAAVGGGAGGAGGAGATSAASASSSSAAAASKPSKGKSGESKGEEKKDDSSSSSSGGVQIGITKKKFGQFADWYSQVVTRSEMIEYYDISGCYILRPLSFSIWETIQSWFDGEIKKLGVKNSYFPLFVSQRALQAEKDHIEGKQTKKNNQKHHSRI